MDENIRIISKAKAARLLGINERTVRRMVERGVFREIELGPSKWLLYADLVARTTGRAPDGAEPQDDAGPNRSAGRTPAEGAP